MTYTEKPFRLFQIFSTIVVLGFLSLLAHVLVCLCRTPKSQHHIESPVTLSVVSSGDEPEKPTIPDVGSTELEKMEADKGGKKSPHDRIDRLSILLSQIRSTQSDTYPLITDVAATYILAAEDLLKLHREAGRNKSRAEPHAPARSIVEDTTVDTEVFPLLEPAHYQKIRIAIMIGTTTGMFTLLVPGAQIPLSRPSGLHTSTSPDSLSAGTYGTPPTRLACCSAYSAMACPQQVMPSSLSLGLVLMGTQ